MKAAIQNPAVVLVFSAEDVEHYQRALAIGMVLIEERLSEFGARLEVLAKEGATACRRTPSDQSRRTPPDQSRSRPN